MGPDGQILGMFEEALAGRILAQAVRKPGDGGEVAPVNTQREEAVEGGGFAVDGGGGGPGGTAGHLVLADLGGGDSGGRRGAPEEGGFCFSGCFS